MNRRTLAIELGGPLLLPLAAVGWITLVRSLPDGTPRVAAIVGPSLVMVGLYGVLLVLHLRTILGGTMRLGRHAVGALVEVLLLLAAFGAVYREIGIVDVATPGSPTVHGWWEGLYLSVATFTTLGYGDFYPTGAGRFLAGLQAMTGYVVLGILASTAASVLSPHSPAGRDRDNAD